MKIEIENSNGVFTAESMCRLKEQFKKYFRLFWLSSTDGSNARLILSKFLLELIWGKFLGGLMKGIVKCLFDELFKRSRVPEADEFAVLGSNLLLPQ